LVEHPHFNTSDLSVAAQIERIKAAEPQALIAWTTGIPVATIFRGMIQGGLDIPVVTTNGNQAFPQMEKFSAFLPPQLLIASCEFPEHDGLYQLDPRVEKMQHEMYASLKSANLKSDNMTTITWDVGLIVVNALKKLGPDATAAQLKDYVASLDGFAGVNGLYDFKAVPQRGLSDDNAIIVRFDLKDKAWVWLSKPGGEPLP
jgi:branched-chain amino acid transport system substrate-binding protein